MLDLNNPLASVFLNLRRGLTGFWTMLLPLVAVVTLWTRSRSFSTLIRNYIDKYQNANVSPISWPDFIEQWVKIDHQFTALQKLSTLISKKFGMILGLLIIDDMLYYSTNFNEVFVSQRNTNWMTMLRELLYFGNITAVLLFSANMVSQVEVLHDLLRLCKPPLQHVGHSETTVNRGSFLPFEQYQIFLNELKIDSVAVKAANIFPVTYSLLANVKYLLPILIVLVVVLLLLHCKTWIWFLFRLLL